MTKEKSKTYQIKDTDGEKYTVKAQEYSVSVNGLQFYINDIRRAWFIRWANFRVIKTN